MRNSCTSWSAIIWISCAPAPGCKAGGPRQAGRDRPAPGGAWHPIHPECAGGGGKLGPAAERGPGRGRSPLPSRDAAAAQARALNLDAPYRRHPVAFQRRTLPAICRRPRPSRETVQRLDGARRSSQCPRQQCHHRRDACPAGRTGRLLGYENFAAYKLADTMAGTPAKRARPAGKGLGAGARARAGGTRCAAGVDTRRGRQFRAGALGLALLCREAAPGEV